MTEVEEPQFSTLAERIAALNKQKNFSSGPPAASTPPPIVRSSSAASTASTANTTTTNGARRPPPPPPTKPAIPAKPAKPVGTKPIVPKTDVSSPSYTSPPPAVAAGLRGPPPKLPPRSATATATVTVGALQRAATSASLVDRRPSSESVRSHLSTNTTLSRVSSVTSNSVVSSGNANVGGRKLPPAFGTTTLPDLPPSRREREAKEREEAERQREAQERQQEEREQERERQREERERADRERDERPRDWDRQRDQDRGWNDRQRDSGHNWNGRDRRDDERAPALPSRPGGGRRPRLEDDDDEGPALPPRLPPRRPTSHLDNDNDDEGPAPALPSRRNTVKSALDLGFSSGKSQPRRPGPQQVPYGNNNNSSSYNDRRRYDIPEEDDDAPPPLAPRPSRALVDAAVRGGGNNNKSNNKNYNDDNSEDRPSLPTRPRPRANGGGGGGLPGFYPKKSEDEECMKCRDFSGPDTVAAQFPIARLPRRDPVGYLAHNLCDDFPSETDKARAIFTWCHHNIAYDVDGFFGGCIPRGQSIEERIFSGKAVCEGYARVYEALALAAGLECVVVTGHGKGFGFQTVRPGDPVPPADPTGHAWNAVRIDGGDWKLLDACWGAGNVSDKRAERYEKKFNPVMFTMDNETFGERHFPDNPRHFFRADGRVPTWAEYVVDKLAADPVILYSNGPQQFIAQESMAPASQEIAVSRGDPNERIAFRLGRACRHWTMAEGGQGLRPYPMMLKSVSPDGQRRGGGDDSEMFDVEFDEPLWFWADVPRRRLGRPGDMLFCYAITTMDGRDLRGATMADYRARMGRCSMSMQAICSWKLV
ncbi:hypothetical protein HMPREF1624_04108 [Sporothrix schenckii ATCC 58251]|uniref:Transglutaminase-like domain-containing protein n=1 Tax=Sporothrix schenckii (strain ATCC 58251 / de Perez 2211183) TaxID=1391915 RepID=U7PWT4_SPOS1|nr:hypothetical protein HMPREF1624_04108 [Sporothrix schenckii ATCC 58251]